MLLKKTIFPAFTVQGVQRISACLLFKMLKKEKNRPTLRMLSLVHSKCCGQAERVKERLCDKFKK
jgi:hypothetical protein